MEIILKRKSKIRSNQPRVLVISASHGNWSTSVSGNSSQSRVLRNHLFSIVFSIRTFHTHFCLWSGVHRQISFSGAFSFLTNLKENHLIECELKIEKRKHDHDYHDSRRQHCGFTNRTRQYSKTEHEPPAGNNKKCTYIHAIEHFSAMSTAHSRMFKHLLGKLLVNREMAMLSRFKIIISLNCCSSDSELCLLSDMHRWIRKR